MEDIPNYRSLSDVERDYSSLSTSQLLNAYYKSVILSDRVSADITYKLLMRESIYDGYRCTMEKGIFSGRYSFLRIKAIYEKVERATDLSFLVWLSFVLVIFYIILSGMFVLMDKLIH